MPSIFLFGSAEFEVEGREDQLNDVMSDVESGWANIDVEFMDEEIASVIEFRLSDKTSGTFEFIRTSPTSIKVSIDGVVKTSCRASALIALVEKSIPWTINSIAGGQRRADVLGKADLSKLSLQKKAPKKA